MATMMTCDHCGGLIDQKDSWSRLWAHTIGWAPSGMGWYRDYHATPERDCLGEVLSLVEHADAMASGLAVT